MGWTPLPERRSGSPWPSVGKVLALAGGALACLLLAAIGLAVVAWALVVSQLASQFESSPSVDLYRPTAAESRAAATTVPIAPAGCIAFARVEKATEAAADATAFLVDPNATPARAQVALASLHRALDAALAPAAGPMRQRLVNVDNEVAAAQRVIAGRHGAAPVDADALVASQGLYDIRDRAYTQLRIAERLLGGSCGGHLAPPAERVLLGQLYAHPTTRTTRAPSLRP